MPALPVVPLSVAIITSQPALTPAEIFSWAVILHGTLEQLEVKNELVTSVPLSITFSEDGSALPSKCNVTVIFPSVETAPAAGEVKESIGVTVDGAVLGRFFVTEVFVCACTDAAGIRQDISKEAMKITRDLANLYMMLPLSE